MIAATLEYVTLFPAVVAVGWIVLGLLFVVQREWRLPADDAFTPSVAAIVAAHDEELMIADTIEALLEQEYPALRVHVVSDGSTDRTAQIARRYQDRGVVVHELAANVGKSAAMQHALDRTQADLVLFVDADTTPRPGAVRAMVQQFADPTVGGVTGHVRVENVQNVLTAMQALEYSVIVGLAKRAEQFWGGLFTVSGAAACLRRSALRAVGGWSVSTATEDIEVSWRLQRAGWRLAYEPRALFGVQAPVRLRQLHRQRARWARGMVEVLRLHTGFPGSPNRALIPIGAQALGAAVWMLLATALLLRAAVGLLTGPTAALTPLWAQWYPIALWTLGLFGVQAAVATVFDAAYVRNGWRLFGLFALFPIYFWVVTYPSFAVGAVRGLLSPRAPVWARTERVVIQPHRNRESPRDPERVG
jgi:biofilm PGA synthesis N-glycosyltransferase PgaC